MYHYQSDTTRFLNQYLAEHPEVAAERVANRNLLWDVQLSAEEQQDFDAAKVAKQAYTYYAW